MNSAFFTLPRFKEVKENLSNQRVGYIDITRSLIIILVIIGHAPLPDGNFISWFRMPSLFIISGMLYKEPKPGNVTAFLKKRICNLLIPYFAYGAFFAIIRNLKLHSKLLFTEPVRFLGEFFETMGRLLYGGPILNGPFVVFWFITCLCLSIILFTLIKVKIKNDRIVMLVIGILYFLGILLSLFVKVPFPWGLNIALVCLSFYALGFYSKNFLFHVSENLRKHVPLLVIVTILCVTLHYLHQLKLFHLSVQMRDARFASYPVSTLLVPPLYTFLVFIVAMLLNQTFLKPVLTYIGKNTMPILYLHFGINIILFQLINTKSLPIPPYMFFILIGLLIPLFLAFIFDKFSLTKRIFLGRDSIKLFSF